MATKQYFGEGTATTTRKTKRRQAARKRRAVGRRAKRANTRTAATVTNGMVMIPVPASIAFQLGLTLGRASVQGTTR